MKRLASSPLLLFVAALAFLLLARAGQERSLALRAEWPQVEERVMLLSPNLTRLASLGYNELLADMAWSRTLVYYGDGMIKEAVMSDAEPLLDVVTTLDPYFIKPYKWGMYALTFRTGASPKEEYAASVRLLERAVKYHPEFWEFWWLLGQRYAYDIEGESEEEKEMLKERAATAFERAMISPGAPSSLGRQLASFRTKLGQRDRGLRSLQEMVLSADTPEKRAELLEDYRNMVGDDNAADLLNSAAEETEKAWKERFSYAPLSMYVLTDLGIHESIRPWRKLAEQVQVEEIEL